VDITADIETVSVEQSRRFSKTSEEAWTGVECPYCRASMLFVIARRGTVEDIAYGDIKNAWLYCVNCRNGCVVNESKLVPGKMTFPTPEGTPQLEAQLWEEIRRCLSVSAFNAVAMLCRKLLLHMVLTHKRSIDPEAPPEDLNFAAAVRYLGENGVIYSSDEQPCREYQGRRQQGKPRTTPHHADRSQRHSVVHSLSVHQCLRDASTRKVSHTVCW
jgi:hypothetical protein